MPAFFRRALTLGALTLAIALGGCVAYPGYYGGPYYDGGVVAYGGGWHHGWRDRDWHDHDWRR